MMPAVQAVWRHLLVGARDGRRRWPSLSALAAELGAPISTGSRPRRFRGRGRPSESFFALADYVNRHRVVGSFGFRRGGPDEGNVATSGVEYSVPTPLGSGYTATVEYSVTPFGHGDNLLLVDTEASWVTKRLPVETVPESYVGQLTAFRSLSYAQLSTGPFARPVRTQLSGADARRLVGALNSLPPAPDFFCMEGVELYSISLHPLGHDRPAYLLQAQSCGYDLFVSVNGTPLPPLWGGSCRFVKLLLALVPSRAAGTREWAANCTEAPMTVTTNPM